MTTVGAFEAKTHFSALGTSMRHGSMVLSTRSSGRGRARRLVGSLGARCVTKVGDDIFVLDCSHHPAIG